MAHTKDFKIDDNDLLKNGFKNDETPLDEYHLNVLVDGINHNRDSIRNIDTVTKNSDKATSLAAFGSDTPPSSINDNGTDTSKHSLKKKIDTLNNTKANVNNPEFTGRVTAPTPDKSTSDIQVATTAFVHNVVDDEASVRNGKDKYISGLSNIPTIGTYDNSNEKLRARIDSLNKMFDSYEAAFRYVQTSSDAKVGQILTVKNGNTYDLYLYYKDKNLEPTYPLSKIATKVDIDALDGKFGNLSDKYPKLESSVKQLESNKAPIDNPIFTGTPTAPTADTETNNTQIATTEFVRNAITAYGGSGGGGGTINPEDLEGYATEDWVREYVIDNNGAIVYLSTKEHIGRNVELQDVYPIQHTDSTLKIVSKNRLVFGNDFIVTPKDFTGIKVFANNNGEEITVTGKYEADDTFNDEITLGNAFFETQGKYTISCSNEGVGANQTEGKVCHLTYTLYDENGNLVQSSLPIGATPIVIDTLEMNCYELRLGIKIRVTNSDTFNTSAKQSFKVQVEYGSVATPITGPKPETNIGGKQIKVYGKNLLIEGATPFNYLYNTDFGINGESLPSPNRLGVHYYKGVMTEDYKITVNATQYGSSYNTYINTPLLKGDKFTLVFNVTTMNSGSTGFVVKDGRVLYGHVDYNEYAPYEIDTIECDSNGDCDIGKLKYPYSFITIDTSDSSNDGYAIYIKYDPALSRDWTERELKFMSDRIKKLEEIILTLTNS